MKPEPPTHLLDTVDADRTRCGIKRKDKAALPFVLAEHASEFDVEFCPECLSG